MTPADVVIERARQLGAELYVREGRVVIQGRPRASDELVRLGGCCQRELLNLLPDRSACSECGTHAVVMLTMDPGAGSPWRLCSRCWRGDGPTLPP